MPDVTFTVDGDTTKMVISAKKGEAAYKNLGKAVEALGGGMEKAGKKAEQAGKKTEESFGRAALNMGRVVVAARMAITAIKSISDSISNAVETQANRSASKGGAALKASQAAAAGGLDQKIVSAFLARADAMTADDKASLIESISKEGGNIDNKRLIEITSAASSGVFSNAQLQDAISTGGSLDIGAQSAKLSPAALQELETRTRVNALNMQPGVISGDTARVAAAMRDSEDRAHPGKAGLRNAIGFVANPVNEAFSLKVADEERKRSAQERTAAATEKLAADASKLNVSGVTDNQ